MMDILFFQTADPFRYAPMLAVTAPNVTEYCRRHGYRYESYVGIRRGDWNWQASYNRIHQYRELIDRGFRGWAVYLDADAWVHDLDFDLPAYLAPHRDRAAILATAGVTGEHWDINDGVMLVNLGHPQGRALIERWHAAFHAIDDARLRAAETWIDTGNDQDLIQTVLRDTPAIAAAVHVESMDVINSRHARFIRQHLRAQTPNIDARIRAIAQDVAKVAAADGRLLAAAPENTDRWFARLMHPPRAEPPLVEHRAAAVADDGLASRILTAWRSAHDRPEPAPHQRDLVALLDGGDPAALLNMVRTLGRSGVAQGLLGGARQHDRARDPLFARRLALSTHDMLISLAEAVGALPAEDPETGSWHADARAPATLYGRVRDALGVDPAPPPSLGLYLGIAVADGTVLHQRFVEAILAAWRLGAVVDAADVGRRVCELGAGLGLTAFYAARFGIADYTLLDHPALTALQSVLLGRMTGHAVVLAGEPPRAPAFRPLPTAALATLDPGSIDILFAREALSAASPDAVTQLLLQGRRAGARRFLNMDRDMVEAGRPPLADLARAAGWRRVHRQRHWLRKGHVEELFVPD